MMPWDETQLALDLLDKAGLSLTDPERAAAFVAVGAGEPLRATEMVLQIMARTQSALPIDMITRLLGWLDSYAGAEEERWMRALIRCLPVTLDDPNAQDDHDKAIDRAAD
jgi:hypothetical protein